MAGWEIIQGPTRFC